MASAYVNGSLVVDGRAFAMTMSAFAEILTWLLVLQFVRVVGMIAWWWPPFGRLCYFRGGDVDCGRRFLWTPVLHPSRQEDVISHLYLQGDFDSCQCRAECDLYHCQSSHDHHFRGLHLFDCFLRRHGEVHLHPSHCLVFGEVHLHLFHFLELGEVHLHGRLPRYILSLLVAQRCLCVLRVDMKRGYSSPCRKWHSTVILLLGMPAPISSKV